MSDPLFIHPIPPGARPGDIFALTGAEAKHAQVKRLKEGEGVMVSDGSTTAVRGQWTQGGVRIVSDLQVRAPRPFVTVVQALPKADRAELAVDFMVQAGADRIVPWAAERSIASWRGKEAKARAKWENAARAAAKQARRLRIPEVTELAGSVADIGALSPGGYDATPPSADFTRTLVVLHEAAHTPLAQAPLDVDEVVLIVGPEGGVADGELDDLAALGAHPVVLGPEVLRTATAAAIALGALGALTPRWDRQQGQRAEESTQPRDPQLPRPGDPVRGEH
ncbi:16S rRNA (uracil(1498)-N(3))-methyltransferase [Corynebacterium heidelbergense]|uniref:Ribosomal RNA small subunit methyltransferase E n=1 Tax=Corynebacterium heidelbergense TaxID=2055947 RepID=A0A364V906_9CORY|nr:16S rRNA (uracil(1498)-N(3))-methyltransferase [Corynebacterium heidelbergense]RAV33107.1 16S rRNA (uracil(1498)-N(3))-methyltransferase [Corynebacterium heidelbergense]